MSVLSLPTHDSGVQDSWAFLKELLTGVCPRDFAVRLWDGTNLPPDDGQPTRFTLVLQHAGALKRMFSSPTELTLGEAYIYNDYDIEGDIEAAVRLRGALVRARTFAERLRLGSLLLKLPETGPTYQRRAPQLAGELHSKQRDCRAVRYHYDLSNEFYALFLDSRMVYSEGYFASPEDDLDTAQLQKLDKICRALRLNAGERLLDIGCGWGGLIIHAARNFGIEAVGITLSEAQAELARERVREAGLEQRCRVEVCDYRDLSETESFDKIASIGMVEHVGAKRLPGYFAQAWRLLRSGGAFALSGISRPVSEPAKRPGSFSDVYIFPDGELEPIHEIAAAAEVAGFEVQSVENLREHYARTLRHWVRRVEACADDARRIADDVTYRMWRLYMAGSAVGFTTGRFLLYQTLLTKARHPRHT